MADRSLRGMRLGGQSLQSEEGVVFTERAVRQFRTTDGAVFSVPFAADAEIPERWTNPKTGQEGRLLEEDGSLVESTVKEAKPARTHWDMLLERRTRAELEELLEERLQYLRARRGKLNDKKAS
ncbi:RNA polymerase-binding protein RbpA [Amnibacterium sp. CER49]|uniref:RNA polymerase-binding protein RbpA n=1 Tax=Amnibacterium sp. CER49 TaxID=3039161 RepID=UPI00244CB9CD|nr:RNA polymerase-binding protein RbpA [Amnibacterium sp. CER49]MDH2444647.1 RNA polymerase-binding protein RbpA [Amnibacterium sp. CER49]